MIPPDYKALEDEARWQAFCWPLKCEKFLQMADALAFAASLQDEIERLKGYAAHAVGCKSKFCTCGLSREWHGESKIVDGIAIGKAKHAYVDQPCSCGLAPGVEEKGEIENVTES